MSGIASLAGVAGLVDSPRRPEIPNGPQTVARVLDRALAGDRADEPALIGRGGRFTYRELDRAADAAAGALAALGVGPYDRVAATLGNDVDIVVAFLGAMRLGAIWVGVNRPLAPPEKAYILRDAGARVYLGDAAALEQIDALRGELPELEKLVSVLPGEAASDWHRALEAASGAPRPAADIDPYAPAAIAYTSGTTGFPKGAVHSQHNLLLPGAVAAGTGAYPRGQRHGVLLPLTILNLMVLVPVLAFQIEGCCVCMDRVDAEGIAAWVRDEGVEHFAAVPAIYHDLLTNDAVNPADLATLARPEVGGAECPEAFLTLYRERFGSDVSIGYGMTEAPTAVTRSAGDSPPTPGLCGRALPQIAIDIVGEDGKACATGEVGEICVAPAREGDWAGVYTPMLGYWNKPDETAKALVDGVYHSGDLGYVDEQGDLYISGRRNDLILRGGANVYPAEVERILHDDERVAACAVLGKPDPRLGERVVAAVQLAEGAEATADELVAVCRASLARYKVPEEIHFVTSVPRNSMGKIVKRELHAELGIES